MDGGDVASDEISLAVVVNIFRDEELRTYGTSISQ